MSRRLAGRTAGPGRVRGRNRPELAGGRVRGQYRCGTVRMRGSRVARRTAVATRCGRSCTGSGHSSLAVTLLSVSYTHLRAHETVLDLVCRLLLEKKKK